MTTDVDMIIFGRDQDHSGAVERERSVANAGRSYDQRQFRSEADTAIFGHDQAGNDHEFVSQSRRML